MIEGECFTTEYLQAQRRQFGLVDPLLLEKCIHALALLGLLAESEMPFLFKGGTSLLLHLPKIRRLSIDVDIVTSVTGSDLERTIQKMGKQVPFIRQDENERGTRGLPARRHFRYFYNSCLINKEDYVLLDVVEEEDCGLESVSLPIKTEFIQTERDLNVRVPTAEALLADKLTAFAPRTLGVPFRTAKGASMTMQVVKQMFDIGELYGCLRNLEVFRGAYKESHRMEALYRGGGHSITDTLHDSHHTAKQLLLHGVKGGKPEMAMVSDLIDGIKRLQNHLVRYPFRTNLEAKIAAAKVCLLTRIMDGTVTPSPESLTFTLETRSDLVREYQLKDYQPLNRIKTTLPEAFYYLALSESEGA
ncbi:MAG: nucleotidyl transferase AbiEii/AbiGii toxin family protein [Verrucomicrobia bacterium]|nr:nucleotidyl transferase AbiEii/AbiGii toxin family protein [Verrucomicrobiota bacterium]